MGNPVLIDFYADWCGPCRTQTPIIEKLEKKFGDRVEFRKVNVDENRQMATKYGVRSIPTLAIEVDSKIVKQFVGLTQADTIEAALNEALSAPK
ncbi:MAG: thioredoxin [Methanosarcinales archaeon]|nr:MAG: thioredoxin [Methanosarcinales archaeon]